MPTPPASSFDERLRAARELRQLSQGALAARAGLQASAVSHFETGTRKPSFDNLRRLADALRVSTDYLLGRTAALTGSDANVDQLHRRYAGLSAEYQEVADDLSRVLAAKANKNAKTEQVHRLVDALPDDALDAAEKMLNGLSARSLADPATSALAKAPIDDEPVTVGEAQAIAEGERDVEDGKVITAAALRVRLGL